MINHSYNQSLKFFIPLEQVPETTHQQKKVKVINGKPLFYESDDLKKARDLITDGLFIYGLQKSNKTKGNEIFKKGIPVSLSVKWCFDGKKGKHSHGSYRITKPDTDNLQKLLKDCMTALNFWYDDAQVVEEHIGKYWSDIPGIWIECQSLLKSR